MLTARRLPDGIECVECRGKLYTLALHNDDPDTGFATQLCVFCLGRLIAEATGWRMDRQLRQYAAASLSGEMLQKLGDPPELRKMEGQ